MKNLFNYLLLATSVVIIDSCQKPEITSTPDPTSTVQSNSVRVQSSIDLSVKDDYEIRNGMFYFKNYEAFNALDKALRGKIPERRVEFTTKLGFTSLLATILAVRDSLRTCWGIKFGA